MGYTANLLLRNQHFQDYKLDFKPQQAAWYKTQFVIKLIESSLLTSLLVVKTTSYIIAGSKDHIRS